MHDDFSTRFRAARTKQNERVTNAILPLDNLLLDEIDRLRKEIRELRAELRQEVGRFDRKMHRLINVGAIDA